MIGTQGLCPSLPARAPLGLNSDWGIYGQNQAGGPDPLESCRKRWIRIQWAGLKRLIPPPPELILLSTDRQPSGRRASELKVPSRRKSSVRGPFPWAWAAADRPYGDRDGRDVDVVQRERGVPSGLMIPGEWRLETGNPKAQFFP